MTPNPAPQDPTRPLLACFRLGRDQFALPASLVREVHSRFEVHSVPGAPSHIRGLVNLRGQIVTVIDLAAMLELKPGGGSEARHLVVLRSRSEFRGSEPDGEALSEERVGWVVDRLGDVEAPSEAALEPAPASVGDAARSLLAGVWRAETGSIGVLKLAEVLACAEDRAQASADSSRSRAAVEAAPW